MAFDPLWRRRQDRPSVGRDPTFPLITGRTCRNHEVLDQKGDVALEARSRRNPDFDHLLFNCDPRRDLASAPPLLFPGRYRRRGAFVHAARFDVRTAFQTFQSGVLLAQFSRCLLQAGDFTKQFHQQRFKLWTAWRGKGWRRRHMTQRVYRAESTQGKNEGLPTLLPLLRNPTNLKTRNQFGMSQDHYWPASPCPDSAQSKDGGENQLRGHQPDDPPRHAGFGLRPVARGPGRRNACFMIFTHQRIQPANIPAHAIQRGHSNFAKRGHSYFALTYR